MGAWPILGLLMFLSRRFWPFFPLCYREEMQGVAAGAHVPLPIILLINVLDDKAMTAIMAALCGLLLLGLTAWALHKRARHDPTLGAWNRLSRKLARVGLARKDWEGPEDYARRVALARPELGHGMAAIAALYIDLRYGRLSGTEARRKLRRLVADLNIPSRR